MTCPNCQRKVKPIELDRDTVQIGLFEKLREDIIDCIKKNNAVKVISEGEPCVRLSSGKLSPYYIDLRRVLFRDTQCLRKIAEAIVYKLKRENVAVDFIACKVLGAVPLAVTLSLMLNKPLIVVREKEKEHGLGGKVVGPIEELKGRKVLVIDDVATTGKSLLEVIDIVEKYGGVIAKVIVVVDRLEGASEKLSERGFTLEALLTRRDLGITDELLDKLAALCREQS